MNSSFDLSSSQIQWSPLKNGGSFYRTYRLVKVSSKRMELHPTIIWQMIYLYLFLLGLAGVIIIPIQHHHDKSDFLYVIFSILIMLTASGLLYFQTCFINFDKTKQMIWKERKYSKKKSIQRHIPLSDIAALQLLQKSVLSAKMISFYSYELNVILKTGKRIYITDYANYTGIKKDAKELSYFLNVPFLEQT